ncbi:hypothetical protein [Granulicella tundricola]|uniref:hypothetical protein n=1 Tax=Granulicella tundricola TaxID=940615 RepID=UPI0001DB781B|nr:hypothetical protein [Granulicella tundricola]
MQTSTRALGAPSGLSDEATAALGTDCGLIYDLALHGVTPTDIPHLARSAMTVTLLLKNKPRHSPRQMPSRSIESALPEPAVLP